MTRANLNFDRGRGDLSYARLGIMGEAHTILALEGAPEVVLLRRGDDRWPLWGSIGGDQPMAELALALLGGAASTATLAKFLATLLKEWRRKSSDDLWVRVGRGRHTFLDVRLSSDESVDREVARLGVVLELTPADDDDLAAQAE